jgi:hypothetical protein
MRSKLKAAVYALQDPHTSALIRTGCGMFPPKLAPLHRALLAPATDCGRAWIIQKAADHLVPLGIPHELVRLEPDQPLPVQVAA